MTYVYTALGFAILGFVAGLLVGRKNPKVADAANTLAQSAEKLASKQ